MTRWDLARARSQQPARKYKPCGPVGDDRLNFICHGMGGTHIELSHRVTSGDRTHCRDCGYHVCSCPPEYVPHVFRPPPAPPVAEERPLCRFCGLTDCEYAPPLEPTRSTIKARIDTLERFRELGMLDTPGQREAVFRMLLDGDMSGFGVKP